MNLDALLDAARIACKAKNDLALAKCLGVTRATVSNWRTGNRFPRWAACERMAAVTGIPLAVVLEAVASAHRKAQGGSQEGDGGEPDPDQPDLPGFSLAAA